MAGTLMLLLKLMTCSLASGSHMPHPHCLMLLPSAHSSPGLFCSSDGVCFVSACDLAPVEIIHIMCGIKIFVSLFHHSVPVDKEASLKYESMSQKGTECVCMCIISGYFAHSAIGCLSKFEMILQFHITSTHSLPNAIIFEVSC